MRNRIDLLSPHGTLPERNQKHTARSPNRDKLSRGVKTDSVTDLLPAGSRAPGTRRAAPWCVSGLSPAFHPFLAYMGGPPQTHKASLTHTGPSFPTAVAWCATSSAMPPF